MNKNPEFFKGLKEHLFSLGFKETKLPWRLEDDHSYAFIQVEESDSYGFPLYSIISTRYDQPVFRGRVLNTSEFDFIFERIKEDYTLTDQEIAHLKAIV